MNNECSMTSRTYSAAVVAIAAALVLATSFAVGLPIGDTNTNQATAETTGEFVYPAKFVCGSIAGEEGAHLKSAGEEPPVKPGNYATIINLLNPTRDEVEVVFRGSVAVGGGLDGQVSSQSSLVLGPNQAKKLSCQDIAEVFGDEGLAAQFLDGFVTIQTNRNIAVSGVYTAKTVETRSDREGVGSGESIDVVTVEPHPTNATA